MTNIIGKTSVSTIEELNNLIQNDILGNINYSGASKHFRGQANSSYTLQTRIATMFPDSHTVQQKANQIFNSFRLKLRAANLVSEISTPRFVSPRIGIFEPLQHKFCPRLNRKANSWGHEVGRKGVIG